MGVGRSETIVWQRCNYNLTVCLDTQSCLAVAGPARRSAFQHANSSKLLILRCARHPASRHLLNEMSVKMGQIVTEHLNAIFALP